MNKRSLRYTVTAALLTLVSTAAYSQTNSLSATIPFAFRAVGSDFPAGKYKVVPAKVASGAIGTMQLQNVETGKSVFIQAKSPATESKNARPRLTFQCVTDEGCALSKLWSGTGSGMEFPTPALTPSQKERYETVYLDHATAKK